MPELTTIGRGWIPLLLLGLAVPQPQARVFHVDASGGADSNDGSTESTPWKSLAPLRARSLVAGDTVLLRRGSAWANQSMVVQGGGSAETPVVVGDYGPSDAAAPLVSDTATVVLKIAASHVVVRNLAVTGPRAVCVTNSGTGRADIAVRGLDVFDCVTGIGFSQVDGGWIEGNQVRNMHFSPAGSGAIGIGLTSCANVRVAGNVLRDCIGKDSTNHADGGAVELFRSNKGIEIRGNRALRCYGFLEAGGLRDDTIRELLVRANVVLECRTLAWLNLRTPTDTSDAWGVAYGASAIVNNTFVQNGSRSGSAIGCSGTLPDSNQVVVVNNLLAGDSMGGSVYKGGFHRANNLLWSGCARLSGIQAASGELDTPPRLEVDTERIAVRVDPGSPVLGAGIRSTQASQRGFPRILVDALPDTSVDIGAWEAEPSTGLATGIRRRLGLRVLPHGIELECDAGRTSRGRLSVFDLEGRSIARAAFSVDGGHSTVALPLARPGRRTVFVSVELDGRRESVLVPGF